MRRREEKLQTLTLSPLYWVHAKGGTINGGVACVCAKCIFARFCTFLCVSVCFFLPKWASKKRKTGKNSPRIYKKHFSAIPFLACHRLLDGSSLGWPLGAPWVTRESAFLGGLVCQNDSWNSLGKFTPPPLLNYYVTNSENYCHVTVILINLKNHCNVTVI